MYRLLKSDAPITESDFSALETAVGYQFPGDFKALYLNFNGGSPNLAAWAEDENYEPIIIRRFKSIAPVGATDSSETRYIGGCYQRMVQRDVIPPHLVPFANCVANNFICLDKHSGRVIYFAVDVFQPDIAMCLNHVNAQKSLSVSFEAFISSLVDEDEVDFF